MILVNTFSELGDFLEKSKEKDYNYQITIAPGFSFYEINCTLFNYYFSLTGVMKNDYIYLDLDFLKSFIMEIFYNLGYSVSVIDLYFDFAKIDGTLVFTFGIQDFSVIGGE